MYNHINLHTYIKSSSKAWLWTLFQLIKRLNLLVRAPAPIGWSRYDVMSSTRCLPSLPGTVGHTALPLTPSLSPWMNFTVVYTQITIKQNNLPYWLSLAWQTSYSLSVSFIWYSVITALVTVWWWMDFTLLMPMNFDPLLICVGVEWQAYNSIVNNFSLAIGATFSS